MRLLVDNYISTAATLWPNSEDPNYLVENIYDTRMSRVYRTYLTASTEYIIVQKMCAANYMALINHNVSSSATVYVEASSSSGFTGAFSTTIPWSSYSMEGYIPASSSRDFWRLRITGESTTKSYLQIGYLWLSTFVQMPNMKPDQIIPDVTTAKVTFSDGGQAYGDDGYNYRNPTVNLPYMSSDHRHALRGAWQTAKNYKPMYVIIWADNTTEERPLQAVIDQPIIEIKRTDDRIMRWGTTIKFREVF